MTSAAHVRVLVHEVYDPGSLLQAIEDYQLHLTVSILRREEDRTAVTFAAPASGPRGTFPGSAGSVTANTNAAGIARDATGTASCGTGETSALSVPLNSDIYLTGNLLVFRCSGGTRPGEPCTGVDDTSCAPGTCEDDSVKRCTDTNAPCQADSECTGVGAACAVPIRPCPVCNTVTNKCNGGPNNGFACTPGDSPSLGTAYPTTHDCPPPPEKFLGTLPIAFQLTTGTTRRKSVDNLPAQSNVFCGFCRHPSTLAFAKGRCTGGTNANNPCLFETDCPGGTCTTTQGVACSRCSGGSNDGFSCAGDNDCPGGTCPSAGNASCHEACNGGSNPTMPCDVPNCGSGGTCTDGSASAARRRAPAAVREAASVSAVTRAASSTRPARSDRSLAPSRPPGRPPATAPITSRTTPRW